MKKFGPLFISGLIIIIVFFILAVFAEFIAPYSPEQANLSAENFAPPSKEFLLGTDYNGKDILSQIIFGSRLALEVGFLVVLFSAGIGTMIGIVAGFYGGVTDKILMAITDIFMSFPTILLAIFIVFIVETPGLMNIVFALSVTGWVGYARLVRGQVLTLKEREYIIACKANGVGVMRTLMRHILPNLISPLMVQASFGIAGAILAESSLSFLGLMTSETQSWGRMLNDAVQYILIKQGRLTTIYPGVAIMLLVMAFNFVGDGLRDMIVKKQEY